MPCAYPESGRAIADLGDLGVFVGGLQAALDKAEGGDKGKKGSKKSAKGKKKSGKKKSGKKKSGKKGSKKGKKGKEEATKEEKPVSLA